MSAKLSDITNAGQYQKHFNDDFWREIAATVCRRHNLSFENLKRAAHGENVIFYVDRRFVVKIFAPFARNEFAREGAALRFVAGKIGITTPEILHAGEIEGWSYLVMTQLAGVASREIWFGMERQNQIEIVRRLGEIFRELHSHDAPLEKAALARDWHQYIEQKAREAVERQRACGANPEWLALLPSYIAERFHLLPKNFKPVFLQGDVHALNLLFEQKNGRWQISGLIDFGDSFCGFAEYDFLAPGVLMLQGNRELQREMLLAYGCGEKDLNAELRARLMLLTVFYECSDLRKYALRLAPEAVNFSLDELERAIWTFAAE